MSDDDQQRGSKIRTNIWVLVMVAMAVYAGFIYLNILIGSGAFE